MHHPIILRLAIPSPLRQHFDYLAPQGIAKHFWQKGMRIKVPFGKRECVGILLDVVSKSEISSEKLKFIFTSIDEQPIISTSTMKLLTWAAEYYHHPIGDVMIGTLPRLIRQGKKIAPLEYSKNENTLTQRVTLNESQRQAVAAINTTSGFKAFLCCGVTGSGKTEVYLQVIENIIAQDKQALILVPEIGLTPQILSRFTAAFDCPIVTYHSNMTEKQRAKAWMAAKNGEAKIIIGTRSAIFIPLPHCGIIIIDEEHDTSFKQQAGFRYSARDCGVIRAKIENIPIVLGSATPSLESIFNVEKGRYSLLSLPHRPGNAIAPTITVVDSRGQHLKKGFSSQSLQKISQHLKNQGQVLLFLNRRGYAPTLLCHQCGYCVACHRCDARLTYHIHPKRLVCHHCGATKPIPINCPDCRQTELMDVGLGTEQLESTIRQLFPNEMVIRIDRDSTRSKSSFSQKLEAIHNGEARILIGTQMISKGHHFANLTLVVIIDIDSGLYSSDFRALEHTSQQILQVAGRSGRAEKKGEVLIQTHHPDHSLLQQLITEGYSSFAAEMLAERRQTLMPPFSYFALLRAEAVNANFPRHFLEDIKQKFSSNQFQVNLLGPIASILEKKAGRYRYQLLIQASKRPALHQVLKQITTYLKSTSRKVRWSLDVDPIDML